MRAAPALVIPESRDGRYVRVADRLILHGEPLAFRALCERVVAERTRYVVFDLDRPFHFGCNMGEALGRELMAYRCYGPGYVQLIESGGKLGPFVMEWLRSRFPSVRVLISSASPQPVLEVAAEEIGADDVFLPSVERRDDYYSAPAGLDRWLRNMPRGPGVALAGPCGHSRAFGALQQAGLHVRGSAVGARAGSSRSLREALPTALSGLWYSVR